MNYQHFFEYEVGLERLKWKGDEGLSLCPLHDDTKPSFSPNRDTGLWYCHSGCGGGNIYQLAVALNMDNHRQYIDSSTIDSKNYRTNGYEPNNAVKSENKQAIDVGKMVELEELKNRYGNNVKEVSNSVAEWKRKYMGKDDDGRSVWFYDFAIKHHKGKDGKPPYWNTKSIDKKCQIFMAEEMSSFDKSKPLIIYEGEKDALIGILQGISFSGGCGSMPDDISQLLVFPATIIIYDNDDAGRNGAKKLAERIKRESPSTIVRIAKWDESLPKGYDVCDDTKTGFAKFDEAVINATEYTIPIPKQLKGFKVMDANELINTYKEPPKSIVEHLMVEGGVSLISGTDGVGKTWLGLQMAICIASGKEFLGFAVKKRPVLVVQFELSPEQLSDRLKRYDLSGTEGNLDFVVLTDEDLIFTDAWKKIEQTIDDKSFVDGVVFIDNLYTSTNADVSTNQDLKPLLKRIDRLKRLTGNAFGLIGHHNKNDGEKEPLLTKHLITGGKTLTNYVSNVFQLGSSSMGADVRRAKITKTRDSYTDLENLPIRLEWSPEECLFHRKGIISNEVLHTMPIKKQWEIKILLEMADRMNDKTDFNRQYLMGFIESMFPIETNDTNYKKGSRWLNKMVGLGLITGGSNSYKLNRDEIRYLESDKEEDK